MANNHDTNNLDIFGQQPFFTMNTLIYFAFALPPPPPSSSPTTSTTTAAKSAILSALTNGLERLYKHFPWLTHGVINEGASKTSTGTYKLVPVFSKPGIIVKDLSGGKGGDSTPNMSNLQCTNFPMQSVDERVFAPRATFPGPPSQSSGDEGEGGGEGTEPTPPFLIQATFIPGGLIVTFLAQHNCMDMTGQAHIIHLLHKACTGTPFSDEELCTGNMERGGIVPLLDDSWVPERGILERHDTSIAATATATATSAQPPQPGIWVYFNFSSAALRRVKEVAGEGLEPGSGLYVSTDDALTAVLWQAIVRARMPRLNFNSSTNTNHSLSNSNSTTQQQQRQSKISRAIDVRPHLNISPTYPGPIQDNLSTTLPLCTLHCPENLGSVASRLRSALAQKTDVAYSARAFATLLARKEDKRVISSTAGFDLSVDVIVSSWARVRGYEWDFGLGLCGPRVVRRPHFEAVEGLVFLMPKTLEGDVVAAVCLRGEDMEKLKGDGEFARYAEYIG